MDHIYARIKRQRVAPFRKVVSNAKLFDSVAVDVDASLPYSPDILLDEDDWFRVSNFSEQNFFPEFLKHELEAADVEELSKSQFNEISFLMSVQDGGHFFQRVLPGSLLTRKVIHFGDAAVLEEAKNRIIVKPLPDAMYFRSSDALLFRDLAGISPMFKGIDTLFKEATEQQVQSFLDQEFISAKEFGAVDVSKPNRKRITMALETLDTLSYEDKNHMFSYIKDYCEGDLQYDENRQKFVITKNEDVKTLVFGIEERFYTTNISRERRLANSVVSIA